MRLELAAGAGDGRRARDGAGLRRRLGAAPGLDLGVTRQSLNLQCVVLVEQKKACLRARSELARSLKVNNV